MKLPRKNVDAILACRVQGFRLYGKPLQCLVSNGGITIIEHLIQYLKEIKSIRKIILAISEGKENYGFIRLAKKLSLHYIIGDQKDVLQRIIDAGNQECTENVFQVTTECPFILYEYANEYIQKFLDGNYDLGRCSGNPEGTGFEIISMESLKKSHNLGSDCNKSELVTSYICENQKDFKIFSKKLPKHLCRPEVRLTVDYPEDLVFCRKVYNDLKKDNKLIRVDQIIEFWDKNPELRKPLEDIGIDWGKGRLIWDDDKIMEYKYNEK